MARYPAKGFFAYSASEVQLAGFFIRQLRKKENAKLHFLDEDK